MQPDDPGRRSQHGCDRFDAEVLPRLIAGQPAGAHLESCVDCQRALAQHEALVQATGQLYQHAEPRPDWQARTLAEIARRTASPRRSRWSWAALLGAATTIAAVLLLWRPLGRGEIGLQTEVQHVAHVRGSGQAAPGDLLTIRATTAGHEAELRVYRDDRDLVYRCGAGAPCVHEHGALRGQLTLPSVGRYRPLLVIDPPGNAAATSTLDADVQALRDAGARIELAPAVDVW